MMAFRVTVDRDDDKCRFFSTHADDQVTLTMGPDVKPILGHWTNYPATAVKRMSTNFAEGGLLGVDMSIACDIPVASGRGVRSVHACSRFDVAPCPLTLATTGLSTSSAIFCGVWLALNARNAFDRRAAFTTNITSPEDLMEYVTAYVHCDRGPSHGLCFMSISDVATTHCVQVFGL